MLRVVDDPWLRPNPPQTQVVLLSTISYGSCSWSLGCATAPGRPEQGPQAGSGSVSINERWDSGSASTSLASKPSLQILPYLTPMARSTLHRGPSPKKNCLSSYVYCPSTSISTKTLSQRSEGNKALFELCFHAHPLVLDQTAIPDNCNIQSAALYPYDSFLRSGSPLLHGSCYRKTVGQAMRSRNDWIYNRERQC